jgi:hypothetical protein
MAAGDLPQLPTLNPSTPGTLPVSGSVSVIPGSTADALFNSAVTVGPGAGVDIASVTLSAGQAGVYKIVWEASILSGGQSADVNNLSLMKNTTVVFLVPLTASISINPPHGPVRLNLAAGDVVHLKTAGVGGALSAYYGALNLERIS